MSADNQFARRIRPRGHLDPLDTTRPPTSARSDTASTGNPAFTGLRFQVDRILRLAPPFRVNASAAVAAARPRPDARIRTSARQRARRRTIGFVLPGDPRLATLIGRLGRREDRWLKRGVTPTA